MERKTAPFSLDRKGYHVSWDAIPAWVCTQCGESYFEAKEVELIQKAHTALEREGAALVGVGPLAAKS
jgi:YgiT-type zinc finger domain-containing protein